MLKLIPRNPQGRPDGHFEDARGHRLTSGAVVRSKQVIKFVPDFSLEERKERHRDYTLALKKRSDAKVKAPALGKPVSKLRMGTKVTVVKKGRDRSALSKLNPRNTIDALIDGACTRGGHLGSL